jgi:hypothetical protein
MFVTIHGGLWWCGVFSTFLGSMSRGFGVAGLCTYSSVIFRSTQKGHMGCVGLVIIRIVVFTLFNSRISARVGRLRIRIIHFRFGRLQIVKVSVALNGKSSMFLFFLVSQNVRIMADD